MMNSPPPPGSDAQAKVDAVVRAGPTGTLALAGLATTIVVLIWFAFYFLVFVPRGFAS